MRMAVSTGCCRGLADEPRICMESDSTRDGDDVGVWYGFQYKEPRQSTVILYLADVAFVGGADLKSLHASNEVDAREAGGILVGPNHKTTRAARYGP